MKVNSPKVKRLLNTARGQIDGIAKMLDEGRDAVDVANQIMAVKAVLNATNKELLSATLYNAIVGENCAPTDEQLSKVRSILEKVL